MTTHLMTTRTYTSKQQLRRKALIYWCGNRSSVIYDTIMSTSGPPDPIYSGGHEQHELSKLNHECSIGFDWVHVIKDSVNLAFCSVLLPWMVAIPSVGNQWICTQPLTWCTRNLGLSLTIISGLCLMILGPFHALLAMEYTYHEKQAGSWAAQALTQKTLIYCVL